MSCAKAAEEFFRLCVRSNCAANQDSNLLGLFIHTKKERGLEVLVQMFYPSCGSMELILFLLCGSCWCRSLPVYFKPFWFLWSSKFMELECLPKKVNCALWCHGWAKWNRVDGSVWARKKKKGGERKKKKSAGKCLRGALPASCTPPPSHRPDDEPGAAWKVSAWGTCGINLDLKSPPPTPVGVSTLFPSRLVLPERPWLVISRNRALCPISLSWTGFWERKVCLAKRTELSSASATRRETGR